MIRLEACAGKMDLPSLLAGAPSVDDSQQVIHVDDAVAGDIGRAASRAPVINNQEQVIDVHHAVAAVRRNVGGTSWADFARFIRPHIHDFIGNARVEIEIEGNRLACIGVVIEIEFICREVAVVAGIDGWRSRSGAHRHLQFRRYRPIHPHR